MQRRHFLQGTGATLFAHSLLACKDEGITPVDEVPPNEITLTTDWLETTLDGVTVRLRAYNGVVPGPILDLRAGETLLLTVDNQLTPYDSSDWDGDHNVPHHLSATNIHLHGMDVIPHLFDPFGTSNPQAPMLAIGPGEVYTYPFDIPADHPGGLYWYHPHHHGSTAVQAVSGMAGAVVVRGTIDEVPEIAAAREKFLVLSDIGLFESDDEPGVWLYEPAQNVIWSTFPITQGDETGNVWTYDTSAPANQRLVDDNGGFTTGDYALRFYAANGVPFFREDHDNDTPTDPTPTQLTPHAISMRPGEVVRLRVLNACSDLCMPLVLDGLSMHLYALDGTNFTALRTLDTVDADSWDGTVDYNADTEVLVLAPANRAEMLLRSDTPGTYQLVQLAHSGQQFLDASRKVIAEITVEGEPMDMALPTSLPEPGRRYPLITADEIVATRDLHFMGAFPGVMNPEVGIDFSMAIGKDGDPLVDSQYETTVINATVQVGTAEAWRLMSPTHADGNAEGHPFHIHVNPFEVKEIDGVAQPPGTYLDTCWIGKNQQVLVWMRFEEWAGKAVYHCHILPHEDTGMMHNLLIEPA